MSERFTVTRAQLADAVEAGVRAALAELGLAAEEAPAPLAAWAPTPERLAELEAADAAAKRAREERAREEMRAVIAANRTKPGFVPHVLPGEEPQPTPPELAARLVAAGWEEQERHSARSDFWTNTTRTEWGLWTLRVHRDRDGAVTAEVCHSSDENPRTVSLAGLPRALSRRGLIGPAVAP
jgi:hypothetical protein